MKSLRGKPAADRGLGSRETERQTAKDEKINEQDDTEGAKMRGQMRMRQKKVAREKEMEKPEKERKEKKEAQGPGRKAGDRETER